MKTVEHLFPEFCNIYGESYSMTYLGRSNRELSILQTNHKEIPAFVKDDVDMIYLGCSPESKQEMMIQLLMPYKDRICDLIDKGTIFLATGNALEMFGKEIRDGERVIPALGIFDFYAVRYMHYKERHNSRYIADFHSPEGDQITLLGHKSQFSFSYGDFSSNRFARIEKGVGMNPETMDEGICRNHFFGTYSLGPYLVLNPPFAKYLLRVMGLDDSLAFEKEAMKAYEYRWNELKRAKN